MDIYTLNYLEQEKNILIKTSLHLRIKNNETGDTVNVEKNNQFNPIVLPEGCSTRVQGHVGQSPELG